MVFALERLKTKASKLRDNLDYPVSLKINQGTKREKS